MKRRRFMDQIINQRPDSACVCSEDFPLQEIGVRHKVVHDAAEQVSRLLTKGM
jgi:hypothetical protein